MNCSFWQILPFFSLFFIFLFILFKQIMATGFLKVAVLEIQSEYYHPEKNYSIRLTADDAVFTFDHTTIKNSSKKSGDHTLSWDKPQYHLFPLTDHFQLKIFENEETDTRFGFFKIPMAKLYDLPRKNHLINTKCVWIQKADNQVIEGMSSATVRLSIVYLDHSVGTLLIDVKQADLERDTEVVGNMDPYLVCTIGDVSSKTDVSGEPGKNPKWNQVLSFRLESIPSKISFQVQDQDMVSDDMVGSATLNPQQQQILIESQQAINREIPIYFEDKKAGTIKLSTFFTLEAKN